MMLECMQCYVTELQHHLNNDFREVKMRELQIFNVESWLLHHGKKLQESVINWLLIN